jgi:pyruvate formate lyase activating enzyme
MICGPRFRTKSLKGQALASSKKDAPVPLIFSIQHFCLQDGPGIRSMVFFKGCPLRCAWCQNPESWKTGSELAFKAHLCKACGACVDACPEKAILSPGNRDTSVCRLCFECAENCPQGALARFGIFNSVDQILNKLRPEYPYYVNSGGGVTFSGGEPAMYPAFAAELAQRLKHDGIHVAMETCGMFDLDKTKETKPYKEMQYLLANIDLVIFDVKLFHEDNHRKFCGSGNKNIKKNLKTLSEMAQKSNGSLAVWPRLPVIPGITDTRDNLSGWAGFLAENNLFEITLVPYHNMGESKRAWLGLESAPDIPLIDNRAMQIVRETFSSKGIKCCAPGEES